MSTFGLEGFVRANRLFKIICFANKKIRSTQQNASLSQIKCSL